MNNLELKMRETTRLYQENIEKLLESIGTENHKKYVEVEKELNAKGIRIRKALGIDVNDPCPVNTTRSCDECSGVLTIVKHKCRKTEEKVHIVSEISVCSLKTVKEER